MKKTILSIIVTCVSVITFAQGNYQKGMEHGIEMLDKANTLETAMDASNYFERIAEADKIEWLPLYYSALSSLTAGFFEDNNQKKDELYKRGLSSIERAKKIKQNESELAAMEAYLRLMYIANDAMKRAPEQTGEAIGLLEEAKLLNPNNPRPWLIQGQNTFYTPEFFGGGAKNAKPLLEKANELYKTFKPSTDFMPDWGKERCEKLLNSCNEPKKE